jgi:hypothetical protein
VIRTRYEAQELTANLKREVTCGALSLVDAVSTLTQALLTLTTDTRAGAVSVKESNAIQRVFRQFLKFAKETS